MRKFRFRLEKLLELRRHVEREWEIKLSEITGTCALIRNRMNEINTLIGTNRADRFVRGGAIDYHAMQVNELYSHRLAVELEERKKELDAALVKRAEIQKEYLEHSKRRKVLDKLREKREAEYYRAQKIEEFKVMDEISSSSFIRKQGKAEA